MNSIWMDSDRSGTVFRDVIMLVLAGFVVIVFLLLPHINPVAEKDNAEIESPGNLIFRVEWTNFDADVDLWVKAPGQQPVGYANSSGPLLNLLRDDLGTVNDKSNQNNEIVFSRSVEPGEYIVNLHAYSNRSRQYPIPCFVTVRLRRENGSGNGSSSTTMLWNGTVDLGSRGKQVTVVRFRMDENQKVVRDSVNKRYTNLREFQGDRP